MVDHTDSEPEAPEGGLGERAGVDSKRDEAKKLQRAADDYLKEVMGNKQGRKWLYGILTVCRIYQNPFVAGDPTITAFRCGEMNVGQWLLADVVRVAPDLYTLMMKEAEDA